MILAEAIGAVFGYVALCALLVWLCIGAVRMHRLRRALPRDWWQTFEQQFRAYVEMQRGSRGQTPGGS